MTTAADIVHFYRKYYAGKYLSRVLQSTGKKIVTNNQESTTNNMHRQIHTTTQNKHTTIYNDRWLITFKPRRSKSRYFYVLATNIDRPTTPLYFSHRYRGILGYTNSNSTMTSRQGQPMTDYVDR